MHIELATYERGGCPISLNLSKRSFKRRGQIKMLLKERSPTKSLNSQWWLVSKAILVMGLHEETTMVSRVDYAVRDFVQLWRRLHPRGVPEVKCTNSFGFSFLSHYTCKLHHVYHTLLPSYCKLNLKQEA